MSFFRMSMTALSLFFLRLAITSEADPNYVFHFCSNSTFEPKSSYETNRDILLRSLASNSATNNHFSTFESEDYAGVDDAAYGLFLCRGDLSTHVCRDCVNFATEDIVQKCPVQNMTIIWYEECLLRYSKESFFNNRTDASIIMYHTHNRTFATSYQDLVRDTMNDLASRASNGAEKFATGATNFPWSYGALYSLAQCTQDLSMESCSRCLQLAIEKLPDGTIGATVFSRGCIIRYETYMFYNGSAAPDLLSPSPPPTSPSAPPMSPSPSFVYHPPAPSPKYLPFPDGSAGNRGKVATRMVIIAVVVFSVVGGLLGLYYYACCCKNKERRRERETTPENGLAFFQTPIMNGGMESTGQHNNVEMHCFNLRTIKEATNNFSDANKLGEGGFGPVYKGEFPNGQKIAVKRLSVKSRQGIEEFKNEVMVIVRLQHKNLVKLLGYCLAGNEKLLVYEYMANTSLDAFLFDPRKRKELDWDKRANIINGTAKGLQYLHEDSRLKIIHRDMKASNVLLDDNLNPKISDFGTARIFGENQLQANTERIIGTYGYMAPEYALEGLFSIKSDVYSFGVLMLEIITGQNCRAFNELDDALTLLSYASKLWNEGQGLKLIDPDIIDTCPKSEVVRWIHIALLCVQNDAAYRPSMPSVVRMLGGNSVTLPEPLPPPWHNGRFSTMPEQPSMSGAAIGSLSSSLTARYGSRVMTDASFY